MRASIRDLIGEIERVREQNGGDGGQVAGGLTAYDREVLTAVKAGAASLSFVGSGFVVVCYVLFKELRKFSFKLVFYLALCDMLCSFFSMVGPEDFSVTRTATLIRVHLLLFLLFTGTSLVVTVVCSIGNNHSQLGTWCWSQSGRTGKALNLITFHMPLWVAVIYNGFTYFQVISMLKNAKHALNRWGYYPLILIGSWAFGTINRMHDFIEPSHKIFWLSVLDVRTAGLTDLFKSLWLELVSATGNI